MKIRFLASIVIGLALGAAASAQSAPNTPPASQPPAPGAGQGPGQGPDQGQRGGRGGWGGGGGGMMGRGLNGTVTAVAADSYTIKTDAGETYTVHFGSNTRILKQTTGHQAGGDCYVQMPNGAKAYPGASTNCEDIARMSGGKVVRGSGEGAPPAAQPPAAGTGPSGGQGGEPGRRGGGMGGSNPPEPIKATDIKVGDTIAAIGEVDAAAKSVGAVTVVQIDPALAKQMREMQANYGKTWLMGKVTAIDGAKVTLLGSIDSAPHTFAADENTAFRKRRDPITLADIQVGDTVRVEGTVKDGTFLATTVNAMGMPPGGTPTVPRNAPPQPPAPAPIPPPPPPQ